MAVERIDATTRRISTPAASGFVPVPAVERAMRLLRELALIEGEASLGELSSRIGAPRSTTYSILSTLESGGLVQKHAQRKTYRLGVGVLELGGAYSAQTSLLQAFNGVARTVVQRCGETVKLAVLDGRDVVYVGKQEGTSPVRTTAHVGSRIPAHPTAIGRVLLADLDCADIEALYLGHTLEALTSNTVTSLPQLREQLAQVRAQGYAVEREEVALGLQCVAAPVRDQSGRAVAGISVGVAISALDEQRLALLLDVVGSGARELSRMLGWSGEIYQHGDS